MTVMKNKHTRISTIINLFKQIFEHRSNARAVVVNRSIDTSLQCLRWEGRGHHVMRVMIASAAADDDDTAATQQITSRLADVV